MEYSTTRSLMEVQEIKRQMQSSIDTLKELIENLQQLLCDDQFSEDPLEEKLKIRQQIDQWQKDLEEINDAIDRVKRLEVNLLEDLIEI